MVDEAEADEAEIARALKAGRDIGERVGLEDLADEASDLAHSEGVLR